MNVTLDGFMLGMIFGVVFVHILDELFFKRRQK